MIIKYFMVEIEYSASDISRLIVKGESKEQVQAIFDKDKFRYRDITIKEYPFRDISVK